MAEEIVAAACVNIGLPAPVRVAIHTDPLVRGSASSRSFPKYAVQDGRVQRVLVHAAIGSPMRSRAPCWSGLDGTTATACAPLWRPAVAKLSIDDFKEFFVRTGQRTDVDLLGALVAEGAAARKGDSKPTAFHFTAGQQRFLMMVRELCAGVDAERLAEALVGPWRYDPPLPVLGWDARGERIYALRGADPAKEKKLGVPGADWLGVLGLRFIPVAARGGRLLTTGCAGRWKEETFTWPLWNVDLTSMVAASLVADGNLAKLGRGTTTAGGV